MKVSPRPNPIKEDSSLISYKDLSTKLSISDLRTLQSTEGFPKPVIDEDLLYFPKKEVCEFFNVEHLDENFITLKEAADILDTKPSNLHQKAFHGEVPSYRLKQKRGSAFLFRKSEITKVDPAESIEPNHNYINLSTLNHKLTNLFIYYLTEVKHQLTERETEVLREHLCNNVPLVNLSDKFELTPTRTKQILQKGIKSLKRTMNFLNYKNYEQTVKENIELKRKLIILEGKIPADKNTGKESLFFLNDASYPPLPILFCQYFQ